MQLLKIVFLYIVSLLLGAGLLSGCGGTDQNDDEILSITVPEGATSGDLKEIAREVMFTPLKMPDSVFISTFNVKVYGDLLFNMDRGGQMITVFDVNTGDFIAQLNESGDAPGKYQRMYTFAFNPAEQKIYVMSQIEGMYVYDYPSMQFVEKFEDPNYMESMEVLPGNRLFTVSDDYDEQEQMIGFRYWDTKFEKSETTGFENSTFSILASTENAYYRQSDGNLLFVYPQTVSRVYKFDGNTSEQLATIDFGNKGLPEDIWNQSEDELEQLMDMISREKPRYHIHDYVETESRIYFWFFEGLYDQEPDRLAVYSKEYQSVEVYDNISSDLLYLDLPRPHYSLDDSYVNLVYYGDIKAADVSQLYSGEEPEEEDILLMRYYLH
mgnify:CR=1 FL=1